MSFEPIFFQSRGAEEFRFLSNFWLSPFALGDHKAATVEHYYQAHKTRDASEFDRILAASSPAEAKTLGMKVRLRDDWEKPHLPGDDLLLKDWIMLCGLRAKFEQNHDLRAKLIATRNRPLVEYAPWGDTYWGVNKDYVGRNMLGTLLMLVRATLGREMKT